MKLHTLTIAAAILTMTGCTTMDTYFAKSGASANPIVDLRDEDPAVFQQDLAECRRLVAQNKPFSTLANNTLTGGAVGAAGGAAVGAASTAVSGGLLAPTAAASTVLGSAAGGVVGGAVTIADEINAPKQIVGRCLMFRSMDPKLGRKYQVVRY